MFSVSEHANVKNQVRCPRIVRHQMIAKNRGLGDKRLLMKKLSQVMRAQGMSQTALADAIGVNKSYISEIASGKKRPSYDVLLRLLEELRVDPNTLLGTDTPNAQQTQLQGLHEPETAVFEWPAKARLTLSQLAPSAKTPAAYQVNRHMPSLGYLPGDIVIIDLGSRSQNGDVVLANQVDRLGNTRPLLRRLVGSHLAPEYADQELLAASSATVAILGSVQGSFRNLKII